MFIVDDILTAPGKAMLFLFRELAKKAKDDFLDDDAVKQELQEIYALLDSGNISGNEFESRELRLLHRLEQIARIKSGETLELPPAPSPDAIDGELVRDQENLERVIRWREEQHAASSAIDASIQVSPLSLPRGQSPAADPLVIAPGQATAQLPGPSPSLFAPSPALPASSSFTAPTSFAAPPPLPPPSSFAPTSSFTPPSFAPTPSFTVPASLTPPPLLPVAPAPDPGGSPAPAVSLDRRAVPVVGLLTMSQVIDCVFRGLATLKLKVSSVTSIARDEAGWRVAAEILERRSVPDTGDLLGVYELRLDEAGNILRYERTRLRRRSDLGR